MATIVSHMDINIPKELLCDMDQLALPGIVSVGNLVASKNGKLNLSCTTFEKVGTVEIRLTTSSDCKENEHDNDYLIAEVPDTE